MEIVQAQFICRRDGLDIKGMQYRCPDGEKRKFPAMIISHGFTGNYTDMAPYCLAFCREGYAVFCFSFCGGSSLDAPREAKSGGDSRDMNITSEVQDLCAVIEYVKTLEFVDEKQIILFGESQGGFVSGIAAAKYRDDIQKLIMLYPALCIPDHARRGRVGGASYDPRKVPDEIDCGRIVIGKKFHEDVCNMDPFLELEPYQGPVLMIHGTEDQVVDISYSMRARDSYEKGQCTLLTVRGMGHGADKEQKPFVIDSVRQFLAGRKEIFSFEIVITHSEFVYKGKEKHSDVYFVGYCEHPYFRGTTIPEGVDHQISEEGKGTSMRAEYTFDGVDETGSRCFLHVVNQWGGKDWKPKITTDSKRLAWVNDAELTAVLEGNSRGLTVRVFGM